jgi:hypothetical protein
MEFWPNACRLNSLQSKNAKPLNQLPHIQLSADYRLKVCEFGERVTSSVVSFCGEDRNVDENVVKFFIQVQPL